ncbi:MAG: helix-turn-helix domain-containing protein [Candidatus Thorarchaeota archaeon]
MADISKLEDTLFDLDECITSVEASKLTGISRPTITSWCERYKIGKKIGGRWYVNPDKLNLLLKGALKGQ